MLLPFNVNPPEIHNPIVKFLNSDSTKVKIFAKEKNKKTPRLKN